MTQYIKPSSEPQAYEVEVDYTEAHLKLSAVITIMKTLVVETDEAGARWITPVFYSRGKNAGVTLRNGVGRSVNLVYVSTSGELQAYYGTSDKVNEDGVVPPYGLIDYGLVYTAAAIDIKRYLGVGEKPSLGVSL